jgi:hypothetical protein
MNTADILLKLQSPGSAKAFTNQKTGSGTP